MVNVCICVVTVCLAHRRLYSVAGILHRDIKPGNIMIYPDGEEGNRGVLIDYDHAIRIADTSPYSTKRKIVRESLRRDCFPFIYLRYTPQQGTYLFMSWKALEGNEPHTCLDDLESFYYVMVYLVRLHAEKRKDVLPFPLSEWARPSASGSKHGFFLSRFDYAIDPRLGKPFKTLVEGLHTVFRNMVIRAALTKDDEPPPVFNPEEIYDMMLAHVRDAIDDLNRETQDGTTPPCNSFSGQDNVDVNEDGSPCFVTRPVIPSGKRMVRTLAANRAIRKRSSLCSRI